MPETPLYLTGEQLNRLHYILGQEKRRNQNDDLIDDLIDDLMAAVYAALKKSGYQEEQNRKVKENVQKYLHARHTEILRDAAKPKETEGLLKPECILGYTDEQVTRITGARLYDFRRWMRGQTGAICDGRAYNHETQEYEPTGCGPHGYVTYRQDVERFLLGLPVVD